jgi:adenine-specific DNA-methyltransferase
MKGITRTELVWVGKYDDEGNLRPVERTILPFQVVETVNESKADREKAQRDLFTLMPRDDTWRNMLIWGDNKVVMSSLLPRFAGKINLIYIDPPFATGQDFSFRVRVGDEEFVKEPSIIEEKAYRDTWGRGLDSYLQMMYERLVLMRELLAEDGSPTKATSWPTSSAAPAPRWRWRRNWGGAGSAATCPSGRSR